MTQPRPVCSTVEELEKCVAGLCSPIEYIVRHEESWELLPQLVAKGYDIDAPMGGLLDRKTLSYSPLLWCFLQGRSEGARHLLKAGANPRAVDADNGDTIVHKAVKYFTASLLPLALDVFPEAINKENAQGYVPFHFVYANGPYSVFHTLVARGASMRHRTGFCPFAPLQRNKDKGNKHRLLVACGARRDAACVYCGHLPTWFDWYGVLVAAVERCRRVAHFVLRLGRRRGARGNGRDVLRLIAKEIWLTRMDERWEMTE